jgi:serine/threonine protein kinase
MGSSDPSLVETVAQPSVISSPVNGEGADEGRFVVGTLLAGRYRILGLLGRGGMGEVYRATDLMVGQSVALKFLPAEASSDHRLLERFHGEVRVARQVSHPNVCRVYDIGQIDGMPFISMEYVDGEDLQSLLTRIGRLPSDKALETARKLCAGLAAAHDRGVIHRDLKPQNIMMNKRGEVVIMDFGLAAVAAQLTGQESRNGTPAYMSPEQLKGSEVTQRSDIYALGLVLYELFTGKRPYVAKNARQLLDLQESAQLTSMTSIASDVDPAVEKVIRRCLDPDPAKRPASPLSVAAALPGGDPLAEALAAGEMPSPELVAASGKTEGLDKKYSMPMLAVTVACLVSVIPIHNQTSAVLHAPMDIPPDALRIKAREIAASFGYTKKPADSVNWIEKRSRVVDQMKELPEPRKWDEWLASESPIYSVVRESPALMVAQPDGIVTEQNPPPVATGMLQINVKAMGV